jgi:hypothetical protein
MHVKRILQALSAFVAFTHLAAAQIPSQNPDWPCAQRLIQTLEPGSYWAGPPVPKNTDWRDNEDIFNLANTIVDRDLPDAEAMAKLNAYADTVPPEKRPTVYPYLFGALVDQTNDERDILIKRIEQLGHRQNEMAEVITRISNEADADKASNPGHDDLAGKRDFDMRVYREAQFTMRYACEAPANMERRLGAFARALSAKLGPK